MSYGASPVSRPVWSHLTCWGAMPIWFDGWRQRFGIHDRGVARPAACKQHQRQRQRVLRIRLVAGRLTGRDAAAHPSAGDCVIAAARIRQGRCCLGRSRGAASAEAAAAAPAAAAGAPLATAGSRNSSTAMLQLQDYAPPEWASHLSSVRIHTYMQPGGVLRTVGIGVGNGPLHLFLRPPQCMYMPCWACMPRRAPPAGRSCRGGC